MVYTDGVGVSTGIICLEVLDRLFEDGYVDYDSLEENHTPADVINTTIRTVTYLGYNVQNRKTIPFSDFQLIEIIPIDKHENIEWIKLRIKQLKKAAPITIKQDREVQLHYDECIKNGIEGDELEEEMQRFVNLKINKKK